MIFLPSMNTVIYNILQFTEHKYNYCTEHKVLELYDDVYFVPTWSIFASPVTY